jgi:hypothetical protein
MAIVLKTYLQKVADKKDIATVIIPVLLGLLWLYSPPAVFFIGTAFAAYSLQPGRNIPLSPSPENKVNWH